MAKINMTYMSFDRYKDLNSTDFLMLCEFIDNSVSSFIRMKGGYQDLKGCKLKIIIDRSNKKKTFLQIEDNALGFEKESIESCFEIGHKKSKKVDSDLNAFGIGMKQAGFFLGQRIDIDTISKDTKCVVHTELDLKNNDPFSDVEIESTYRNDDFALKCLDGELFNTGTIVKISYIRKNLLTQSIVDKKIKIALKSRYYYYLKSGLELTISQIVNEKNEIIPEKIEAKRMPYEKIDTIDHNLYKITKTSTEILEEISNLVNDTYNKNPKNKEIRDDIIFKIQNHKEFVWNFDQEIIDGIRISGEIGWLQKPSKKAESDYPLVKTYGFNIYQSGRAIYSFPSPQATENDNQHSGTFRKGLFDAELSGGNSHKRRWVGYLDLTNLIDKKDENGEYKYVKPDSNKRGLKWIDPAAEQKFISALKNFMLLYDDYLKAIVTKISQITPRINKIIPGNLKESLMVAADSKYIDTLFVDSVQANFNLFTKNGNNILIVSRINSEENNGHLFYYEDYEFDEKNVIKININPNNNIWFPLIKNDEDLNNEIAEHYHKLGLVFALTQLYIDKNDDPKFNNLLFDKLKTDNISKFAVTNSKISFISILSVVSKIIFKG